MSLINIKRIFQAMAKISGLVLQVHKCVLVPLVSPDSLLFAEYLDWLTVNIPEWSNFKVVSHAEYLGFEVGPTAGAHQWDKVLSAFQHQLSSVTHCGWPSSISVFYYNTTVLYLKSYRRRGVQGVCARGVCKGGVQGVCRGCARGVTLPQIGKNLGVARDNIFSRFGS